MLAVVIIVSLFKCNRKNNYLSICQSIYLSTRTPIFLFNFPLSLLFYLSIDLSLFSLNSLLSPSLNICLSILAPLFPIIDSGLPASSRVKNRRELGWWDTVRRKILLLFCVLLITYVNVCELFCAHDDVGKKEKERVR